MCTWYSPFCSLLIHQVFSNYRLNPPNKHLSNVRFTPWREIGIVPSKFATIILRNFYHTLLGKYLVIIS